MMPFAKSSEPKLAQLIGLHIDTIIFVQNYLQVSFEGRILTLWVWPLLISADRTQKRAEVGYCDQLCAAIGSTVLEAYDVPGQALYIKLKNGLTLEVPLTAEAQTGPEFAMLADAAGCATYIWRPS